MYLNRGLAIIIALVVLSAACSSDDPVAAPDSDQAASTDPADITTDDESDDDILPADTVEPSADDYQATIRRTEHNVPHITAADMGSVGFGYGYAFAEDHACSLADVVLTGRSERSRFFGEDGLTSDVVYAALDTYDRAATDFDAYDDDVQDAIQGYAAGYNTYLDEVGVDDVPGWCAGEEWLRPIDEYDLAAYYRVLVGRASIDPTIDFIASAEPPEATAGDDTGDSDGDTEDEAALGEILPDDTSTGSNAWGIGPDRTADGTTMLVGNPHFPWQGALRFYEVHLTIPGEFDVYGAALLGSPAVLIGFNQDVAWSHTVSAGSRFTAYSLDLVDGDPTRYVYGDEERAMEEVEVTVEVMGDDGTIDVVSRSIWFSHYGPILNVEQIGGWTTDRVLTLRDANADNDEIIPHFLAKNRAQSMDDLQAAYAKHQGIPWVNTVAVSAEGRIWYADTSAAANLSPETVDAYWEKVDTDLITSIALESGLILLDGSDPANEWVDDPEARDPGVVPFTQTPQLERSDYVFNANNSYWFANPDELIEGFDSPVFGRADYPVGPRPRGNNRQLSVENGDAGDDGLFTFEEMRDSAIGNRVYSAEILRDDVVTRCNESEPTIDDADAWQLACDTLATWDLRVDVDSRGAVLWREFIGSFEFDAFTDAGDLFAEPFDPVDPANTPNGLSESDAVMEHLGAAIEILLDNGFAIDTPLGELQFADRGAGPIPIHGGGEREGVSNVVRSDGNSTTTEETLPRSERIEGSNSLRTDGYPISGGTSFIYAMEFTADGPRASSFVTYGNTGDPDSDFFSDQTQRFSDKDWKEVRFTEADVAAATVTSKDVSGPRA
jgi:acyl-homoserine-lactone acylase